MPVSFHYDNYVEQSVKKTEMTLQEAVLQIQAEMDKNLEGTEIISRKHSVSGGKLTVTYECLENISEKVGFEFDNGENN